MKTTIFFTVASLALLMAPDARAAHPENRRYTGTRYRVEEVQKLAHRVEDRARLVHRSAERFAHHRDFREEKALVRLHELEEQARHFHRQVERNRQSVRHTEEDFRVLSQAYTRAAYAMHDLHAFGRIDREFNRLSDAMFDLEVAAEDLFGRNRRVHIRYRDREYGSHERVRVRIAFPRVRASWNWLGN